MLPTSEVTLPPPVPLAVTSRVRVWSANSAVTLRAALMVTVHGSLVQSPLQPMKVLPVSGVAVSVTIVLKVKPAPQVAPQSMPAGADVTAPEPAPVFDTDKRMSDTRVKVAVTSWAWSIVTSQSPVPEQGPPQPPKFEPVSGVAWRVTMVPWS